MSVTNRDRANWALAALETFRHGVHMKGEDTETVLGDLLADLMHLCRLDGHDFDAALRAAQEHFAAEIVEEDG